MPFVHPSPSTSSGSLPRSTRGPVLTTNPCHLLMPWLTLLWRPPSLQRYFRQSSRPLLVANYALWYHASRSELRIMSTSKNVPPTASTACRPSSSNATLPMRSCRSCWIQVTVRRKPLHPVCHRPSHALRHIDPHQIERSHSSSA